jgi:ATP-dependent Clp endopeptidase proteolytic subunit ClpP
MKFENNVEEGTITFRGGVGEFEGYISADMFIDALNEHSGDVTIHLDSTGGSVTDGLAIHNAILAHDGIVNIHIDTMCASIATVIACSATGKVIMNSNGKYMIHRAWTAAMGNCKDFRSMADIMELMDADIAESYMARAGGDLDTWLDMMDKETWMDAEKALELGLIDEIKDVRAAKKKKKKDYTNEEKPEIKAHLPIGQIMAKISATLLEYENK